MKVLVTQVSGGGYEIKKFKTFNDLVQFSDLMNEELILRKNFCYGNSFKDIMKYCRTDKETAKEISKLRWEVVIYNDYIE